MQNCVSGGVRDERMDETQFSFLMTLHLKSHSQKGLEKQYLFCGSVYDFNFLFFVSSFDQKTVRHSRYTI